MKILMGLNAPWVGGTRIHVLTLAQGLIRHNHDLRLVTDAEVLEEETQARGIPVITRVDGLEPMLQLLLDCVHKDRPDLLHAHPAAPIFESYLISRATRIPFVVTMHGEYTMHFTADSLGKKLSRTVAKVIAVSPRVKDYLIRKTPLSPEKIVVIPNGIDTQEFRPGIDTTSIRSELGLTLNERIIMYLGRLDGDKRQAILATANAIQQLATKGTKVHGVFVGCGRLVKELSTYPNLLLTGFRRDLPELLSLADVVVATGRSALEAMAVGKPVLACGKAGYLGPVTPQNWCQAQETNFADHGDLPAPDHRQMASVLLSLLSQASPTLELRDLVSTHYGLDLVLEKTEAVYAQICRL